MPDAQQTVRKTYSKKLKSRLEWDIYSETERLAIEYNGVFWHSFPHRPKNYHQEKTKLAKKAGVRLIHVFEDDWRFKKSIIKRTIRHILGLSKSRRYARELTLKRYDQLHGDVSHFYDRYHLQGKPRRGVTYCLTKGRSIYAAMTFAKGQSDRQNLDDWELVRFASRGSVIGAASKLFKNFVLDYGVDHVLSYSDSDWFDGNLYAVLGFEKTLELPPDYTTVWQGRRRHKSFTRRSNLEKLLGPKFDPSKSEMENLVSNKVKILFNSGRVRWDWHPRDERQSILRHRS